MWVMWEKVREAQETGIILAMRNLFAAMHRSFIRLNTYGAD